MQAQPDTPWLCLPIMGSCTRHAPVLVRSLIQITDCTWPFSPKACWEAQGQQSLGQQQAQRAAAAQAGQPHHPGPHTGSQPQGSRDRDREGEGSGRPPGPSTGLNLGMQRHAPPRSPPLRHL